MGQGRPAFRQTLGEDERTPFLDALGLGPADLAPGLPLEVASESLGPVEAVDPSGQVPPARVAGRPSSPCAGGLLGLPAVGAPLAHRIENPLFLDAVNWIARNGGPWRDLPARFGNWNTVWRRFDRWSRAGVWQRLFEHFQDPDLEWLLLDSTSVRAHQHAAGARKRGTRQRPQPRAKRSEGAVAA